MNATTPTIDARAHAEMLTGALLKRDSRTRRWYANGFGSLSDADVARLEMARLIVPTGAMAYRLAAPSPEPPRSA